jgi:uncharacterized membrane protein YgaE (UPF0421/DUF939 family)
MAAASLVGGGSLLASQAGASAVLVATLQPPSGGVDFSRTLDALVGSSCALVVSSLLLPINPMRLVRESVEPVLRWLIEALEHVAEALRTRRGEEADAALVALTRAGAAQTQLLGSLEAAGEVVRLSPQRRGALGGIDRYTVAAGHLARAVEDVRALARGASRAVSLDDAVPAEAIEGLEQLEAGTRALRGYLEGDDPDAVRAAAVRAAALANSVLEATGNLSAVNIVGQIRMAAVDLLRATGLSRAEAQDAVRSARLSD